MFYSKKSICISVIIVTITLFSCGKKVIENLEKKKFFDLKKYSENEAQKLKESKLLVVKKVSEDGNSETKNLTDVNWQEELSLLGDADLNRIAWTNKYSADTVYFKDNILVTYSALDKNLFIKRIVLTFNNETNECLSISIEKGTENFLYTSWQKLFYTPSSQLNVYGHLSVKWLIEKNYSTDYVIIQTDELQN